MKILNNSFLVSTASLVASAIVILVLATLTYIHSVMNNTEIKLIYKRL